MCVFLFLLVFCILPNPRSDSMHFYAAKIRLISFMAQKKSAFFSIFFVFLFLRQGFVQIHEETAGFV